MGVLVLAVLLICLIASVPIAISLGIAASVGLLIISPEFLVTMHQKVIIGMDSFTLLAIPLFIFAGTIMGHGGIAGRIVNMSLVLVGRVGGGLGMGCTIGQAVSGTSTMSLGSFIVFASILFGSAVTMKTRYYLIYYDDEANLPKAILSSLVDFRLLPKYFRRLDSI